MNNRLPNLIVAGVPKAGTGSLFGYLRQHPDICAADQKEVGYFNFYNPRRHTGEVPPLEDYLEHFAHWGRERYAFEATPTYSYGGRPVIDAIRRLLPDAKVIITLRDPVDRLWSAYTFQRELGNITATFEDYLRVCESRRRDGSDLVPRDHFHGLYIGYYADYIPQWLDTFGDDLRVIFTERLARDPHGVVAGLCRWLGIDDSVAGRLNLAARNQTQHPRSTRVAQLAYSVKRSGDRLRLLPPAVRGPLRQMYRRANSGAPPEQMSPAVRRHVEDLYEDSTDQTAQALVAHGYRDLPSWLRAGASA